MSQRTRKIIRSLAQECLTRNKECPDYGGKGVKATNMALNFFIGAANLAKAQSDTELLNHITSISFLISVRGITELNDLLAAWTDADIIGDEKQEPETKLHALDAKTWSDKIWEVLHCHRENSIPEGVDNNDDEWNEITTAMAWIDEELGTSEQVDADDISEQYSADMQEQFNETT